MTLTFILKLNVDKCCKMTYTVNPSNLCNTNYYIENCNRHYELAKVDSVKDLGIRFDSILMFLNHMNEKVKKAYSIVGIIERNFIYLDKDSFVLPYKSMVRPHLEQAGFVWCVHIKR